MGFQVMLGECRDATPAGELGDHAWFVYLNADGIDQLSAEVAPRGAETPWRPATKPWGLREFVLRTPDGLRIVCGEAVAPASKPIVAAVQRCATPPRRPTTV